MPLKSTTRDAKSILYGVTSSVSLGFFRGQLRYLSERGWSVQVVASPDVEGQFAEFVATEGVFGIAFPLDRDIRVLRDCRALFNGIVLLFRQHPTISNVGTPKAGLILGIAAALTRVPVRIYTLHGLRSKGAKGLTGFFLRAAERLSMMSAHHVVCVSPSLREEVIEAGLARSEKVHVLGAGSVNGVGRVLEKPAPALKGAGDPVIGFVGRLAADKGVQDLLDAFERVCRTFPSAKLLLVGGVDATDPLPAGTIAAIQSNSQVLMLGEVEDVGPYYSSMTVLALPSYREGLPSVVLEAACYGIPAVGTMVTGIRDVIADGDTGWLVPARDVSALADALIACLRDDADRRRRGTAAKAWVEGRFDRRRVWESWEAFYRQSLQRLD